MLRHDIDKYDSDSDSDSDKHDDDNDDTNHGDKNISAGAADAPAALPRHDDDNCDFAVSHCFHPHEWPNPWRQVPRTLKELCSVTTSTKKDIGKTFKHIEQARAPAPHVAQRSRGVGAYARDWLREYA